MVVTNKNRFNAKYGFSKDAPHSKADKDLADKVRALKKS